MQDVINAYLAQGQRMDETLCIYYTIEMLLVLEILHKVGLIHGDFKPDNLLLRNNRFPLTVHVHSLLHHEILVLIDVLTI